MTKQEFAVLMALRDNPGGLLADDFREATKREVSRHNTATVLPRQRHENCAAIPLSPTQEGNPSGLVAEVNGVVVRGRTAGWSVATSNRKS